MSNPDCGVVNTTACEVPTKGKLASSIADILESSQNNLGDCESMVQSIITFIDGDNDTGKDPRETTCMTSQVVNIRDQSESIRGGLVHIVEALGVR